MRRRVATLAARIDALKLRERVFLMIAIIVVLVAIVDAAWVSPARLALQIDRNRHEANLGELKRLREEVVQLAAQPHPLRQAREELARTQAQLRSTDDSIAAISALFRGTTSLREALAHFLRRHPALTLVRTGNLPLEAAAAAPAGTPPAGTPPPSAPVAAARQGFEITVSGPYADLVRFVQTLESAMPDLRWGTMRLQAEQQPPELTLQVFLLVGAP